MHLIEKENITNYVIYKLNESANLIDEFNTKLKEIKTFKDLEDLNKEVENSNEGLVFRMKKSMWHAYDFKQDKENPDIVHYLLSDGISRRKTPIKSLYKYIEIADRAR